LANHRGRGARQAEEAVLHYKTLLAHPLVEAITWWDFVDANAERTQRVAAQRPNSQTSLPRTLQAGEGGMVAGTTTFRTAEDGSVSFNGFLGEYELRYQARQSNSPS